ncbi:TRAP transporter substrate-binding protein DctP [Alkalihalobacillus oceani]|uniref:TRAP transporter substrate-binding protein n=1 Tax=Halalkalibacter oceani TaxID=1653776 RepID=UPI002040CF59|nr:TRAP transporter substrate-binding protein DctP [Halalkalibacter oceani]MCM3759896.1 TRAP transporter substrate-binding protein DctP [Halalkalibacter oceani]
MNIKKMLINSIVLTAVLMLGACGNSQDTTQGDNAQEAGQEAADTTVLKYNSSRPATDPVYAWYEEFFKEVEERSNGTVKFEMYPSESLGKTADMIEASSKGEPIINDGDFAYLGEYNADFGILTAPYFIRDPEDWTSLWDSEVGQKLFSEVENEGMKIMANFYVGPRNLITTTQVNSRDDVQGMTLRTASSKMWTEVGRVLGGEPTNIPITEAYQAFSQGVADGGEMSTSYIESLSWFEVAPYIAETEHILSTTVLIMSADVYRSLPEEAQTAINEVSREYMPIFIERIGEIEAELRTAMEESGAVFTEVDKEPFIEAAQQLPEKFPEWTPGLYEEISAALGY